MVAGLARRRGGGGVSDRCAEEEQRRGGGFNFVFNLEIEEEGKNQTGPLFC